MGCLQSEEMRAFLLARWAYGSGAAGAAAVGGIRGAGGERISDVAFRVLLLMVCCALCNACAVARRAMQAEDARVRPDFLAESPARRALDSRTTMLTDSAMLKGNRLVLGGYGTATPIDARGYYLTCAHCLHGRPLLLFRAKDGRIMDAGPVEVLWKDKSSDLALLYSSCCPPETCGPGSVAPGEVVMAVDPTRRHTRGRVTRVTRRHILHNADIPPGCSGGGLFNERLELVGLNSCVVYRGIWPVFWKRTDSRAVRLGDERWAEIRQRVAAHLAAAGSGRRT